MIAGFAVWIRFQCPVLRANHGHTQCERGGGQCARAAARQQAACALHDHEVDAAIQRQGPRQDLRAAQIEVVATRIPARDARRRRQQREIRLDQRGIRVIREGIAQDIEAVIVSRRRRVCSADCNVEPGNATGCFNPGDVRRCGEAPAPTGHTKVRQEDGLHPRAWSCARVKIEAPYAARPVPGIEAVLHAVSVQVHRREARAEACIHAGTCCVFAAAGPADQISTREAASSSLNPYGSVGWTRTSRTASPAKRTRIRSKSAVRHCASAACNTGWHAAPRITRSSTRVMEQSPLAAAARPVPR